MQTGSPSESSDGTDSASDPSTTGGTEGEISGTPGRADEPVVARDPTEMFRLHPRIRIVWIARVVFFAGFLAAPAVAAHLYFAIPVWVPVAVAATVLLLGITHAILRYRSWRYQIREDAIYLERGVVTQVRTVVPFVRIQHVDSRRGPVERAVGLASCVVYSAGSRGADVRIPGLTPAGADDLREDLKRLAIRAEGEDAV